MESRLVATLLRKGVLEEDALRTMVCCWNVVASDKELRVVVEIVVVIVMISMVVVKAKILRTTSFEFVGEQGSG